MEEIVDDVSKITLAIVSSLIGNRRLTCHKPVTILKVVIWARIWDSAENPF
jgi:hypothetical protein